MYSLLIKNATVYDGTGERGKILDVAISEHEIVEVGQRIKQHAARVIDANGKILAPGFIDVQNHSDTYWQLVDNPALDSMLHQGFTTLMVGNCGASLAPLLSADGLLAVQKWHQLTGENVNWQSFAEFGSWAASQKFGPNVASLVGYSTLRRGLLGDQTRSLAPEELTIIKQALSDAMSQGAFGLSCGLAYSHELADQEEELKELAGLVSEKHGLFSVHLRNESDRILESVDQALQLAKTSGIRLKISHLKIQHKNNWPLFDRLIDRLETERHRGAQVSFDVYPYDTVWQVLLNYLPAWALEGGKAKFEQRLSENAFRQKVISGIESQNYDFSKITIASTTNDLNFSGKTISKIAIDLALSSAEALLVLCQQGGSQVLVFDQSLNQEQVTKLLLHPLGIPSTDGAGFSLYGVTDSGARNLVHQRCFGTTAKFIELANKNGLELAQALKKLTSEPAKILGLKNRGTIAVGQFADLVLFNPKQFEDKTTPTNPYLFPSGMDYVIVNGRVAVERGETKDRSGQFLKKDR